MSGCAETASGTCANDDQFTEQDQDISLQQATSLEPTFYPDSGYNRSSTLVAKYVNRILEDYPTPSERYYDIRLVSSEGRKSFFGEVGDQCIMFHSNRICLLTVAPTHPVIAENKTVERVEHTFEGFEKIDRLACQPQGKRKKGGHKLQKNSPICALICTDGSKYCVTACLPSRLIEINQEICSKPNLVKDRPLSTGFIAILQPSDWKRMAEIRDSLPRLGAEVSQMETATCEDDLNL